MVEWIRLIAPAALVLCVVRLVLVAKPLSAPKLPHPSKIGLPSGGLASPAAAHTALVGQRTRRSWKFW